MNERLKKIRLYFNKTQEEFAASINIKSKAHISSLESGKRALTDRIISDVCNTYNINEEWLKFGTGEMFIENDSSIVSELASEYNLDSKSVKFIEAFLNLTSEQRDVLQDLAISFANSLAKDNEVTATKEIDKDSIESEIAAYREELVAESKGEIYLASGNSKDEKNLA